MKYYAVLDTNVLVSAMLKSGSVPDMIAAEAMYGDIIPVLNDEILAEYEDVLRRPKFRFAVFQALFCSDSCASLSRSFITRFMRFCTPGFLKAPAIILHISS